MLKTILKTTVFVALASIGLVAQSTLGFDVASIKPSPDIQAVVASGQAPHVGTKIDAARVDIGYASLRDLICTAYKVKPYQVTGPDWLVSTRFDIQATMPAGANKDQVPEMLKSLLASRFKLAIHDETKDLSAYVLTVAKGGSKMKEALPDVAVSAAPLGKGESTIDAGDGNQMRLKTTGNAESSTTTIAGGRNGPMKMTMEGGMMHMEMGKVSMDDFVQAISQFLGSQAVLNQTGLTGNYQVALDISQDDLMAVARANGVNAPGMPPPSSDPSGGSIYSSIEKLGLKLTQQKAPVPLVIVDHIEKLPTDN